jgi:hypothetical protein
VRYSFLIVVCWMMIAGCTNESNVDGWEPSPTFKAGDLVLYGTEGKFGIVRLAPEGGRIWHRRPLPNVILGRNRQIAR